MTSDALVRDNALNLRDPRPISLAQPHLDSMRWHGLDRA
jgi:hypothetical protein